MKTGQSCLPPVLTAPPAERCGNCSAPTWTRDINGVDVGRCPLAARWRRRWDTCAIGEAQPGLVDPKRFNVSVRQRER